MTTPQPAPWSDADIQRLLAPVARALPQPTSLSPLPFDLNAGVPDAASLPAQALAEAATRALAADPAGALTYGGALGFEPVRAWIAERQAENTGLAVTAANVMLTSGSAQAIDNIAATFLAAGDIVVMGAPTYPGAIRAFRARGAHIVDVPQDVDGLEMVGLASALEHQRAIGAPAKLIYVIANYDNPSGATLPLHRRQELALLAARYRALVVEDDAYTGIDLNGPPPTSLFQIAGGQGIIRVGTFSKTIATGLRVGWVVADAAIVRALAFMRFDNGSSSLVQRTVLEYLRSGAYEPHVEQLRAIYRERRDVASAAVRAHCGELVRFEVPAGGFFLWLQLAAELEAEQVVRAAQERGVAVTPGRGYFANGGGARQIRLVYSALPPEQLRTAIALFGEAVASVAGRASHAAAPPR
ncbi:MAG: PLP-dependent aminotransferase family protein [Chloroflexi bacterium]|nr:PLP-dependent aminotransferase family protein [Chloroflexota bacterium]